MASNEHLCLIKTHITHDRDELCLIKTMVKLLKLALLQCGIL